MASHPEPTRPLLVRVAAGESGAVNACIERFGPLVWTLVRRSVVDASAAEDLVQEVFIDLWRSAARYNAELSSEATFVATIARRRVIDFARRNGRAPAWAELSEETIPDAADADLAFVDLSDEAAVASRALDVLRPEQRNVLELAVLEGLTHQEVSTKLGLPLGTVKSHVRRGLERVAQSLRDARARGGGGRPA